VSPRPSWFANLLLILLTLVTGGCGASNPVDAPDTSATTDLSTYFITPELCKDSIGPECTRLRLGDSELTTTAPARGKLYSCNPGNPSAPGSIRSMITWIDDADSSWNLLAKPFLPIGTFVPPTGILTITESGSTRTISVTSLPVDRKIGDWPMTQYAALTAIDRNPGIPASSNRSFTLPLTPTEAAIPSCVSLGAIGVTLNGVVFYNAVDGRGNDALAHEIVDVYGGHPAREDYHYHFVPERLGEAPLVDGHSGLVGYIRDGFGIYGYKGVGGVELSNADLDDCHGHAHAPIGYHYHATIEYPYTIGCYRGIPF